MALADPKWDEHRNQWKTCLREEGLTPRPGKESWTSEEGAQLMRVADEVQKDSSAFDQQVEIATTEAECNQRTHLTQHLADIESKYQSMLIVGNESTLAAERDEGLKRLEAAQYYLSQSR